MLDLVQRIEESILERRLFRRGEGILVAVSGGLDSMVLLVILSKLAENYSWRLTVGHFNHRLRGRSSDADERLVERTAKKLGLIFAGDSSDVREFAVNHKVSVEMAARKLRHTFLAQTAARLRTRSIALAHHADDQVELFFLRLLRGAGGEGLSGMKWRSPSPENERISLVRPLLDRSKEELRQFAAEHRILFREDATNAHLDIQRNRIRHELLPLLSKQYQPALSRVILRQMEIIGAEAELVTTRARDWLKRPTGFESLPIAVQRRCLQLQAVERGLQLSFDMTEMLRLKPNRRVSVNDEFLALRDNSGHIVFHDWGIEGFDTHTQSVPLTGRGGSLIFDNVDITWKVLFGRSGTFRAEKRLQECEYFDADKVGGEVLLRHWQPGDRFQPIGMPTAVKLQDLFTNQKVLRDRRHELIVGVTAAGELFWVEGLRMAEGFKLGKDTRRRLQWTWKRL